MSKFAVKARNKEHDSKKVEQFFRESDRVEDLIRELQAEGYLILSIQDTATQKKGFFSFRKKKTQDPALAGVPAKKSFLSFNMTMFDKVSGSDLLSFFVQMVALLKAGVPILRSLTIIEQGLTKGMLKKILISVKGKISQGFSLSTAMAEYPKVFPYFWLGLIEAGETSGNLPDVLEEIRQYQESSQKFKSKLISAMVYPAILICFSVGALTIFMIKIIPTFETVFKSMLHGQKLPAVTQFVLDLSRFLQKDIIWILLTIGGIIAGLIYMSSRRHTKRILDQAKLRFPVWGGFLMDIAIVRFSRGLATMVKSGTPIIRSLEISSRLIGNVVIEDKIELAKEDVKKGNTVATALEKYKTFPIFVTQLISVGEESGSLEQFLTVVANFFEERVNAFIARLSSVIEPVIILFMGIVVGTLVISMFLPLIEISTGGH